MDNLWVIIVNEDEDKDEDETGKFYRSKFVGNLWANALVIIWFLNFHPFWRSRPFLGSGVMLKNKVQDTKNFVEENL